MLCHELHPIYVSDTILKQKTTKPGGVPAIKVQNKLCLFARKENKYIHVHKYILKKTYIHICVVVPMATTNLDLDRMLENCLGAE